jgi:hypothetical protein
VFGAELEEPQTFVGRMEKALEGRRKRVRVINAAIPGANTRDQFYRFLELREAVHADLVKSGHAEVARDFVAWLDGLGDLPRRP